DYCLSLPNVSGCVSSKFVRPKINVGGGNSAMNGTTMPETSINEYSKSMTGERKIGLHTFNAKANPIPLASSPKLAPKSEFRLSSNSTNLGHHPRLAQ